MNQTNPRLVLWATITLFALAGASLGLAIGLLAVALAPENGFADLAAAAVTRIFLIPFGAVVGATIGWRKGSRRRISTRA